MGDWKEKLRDVKRALTGAKPAGQAKDGAQRSEASPSASTPAAMGERAPAAKAPVTKRYVCVGFDFGTSSTKVVVRLLDTGPAFAVPFKELGFSDHPYLAPTRLAVTSDGSLRLAEANGGGWVEELKVSLMRKPWDREPPYEGAPIVARPTDLAAAYIGLVLRGVFVWCERSIRPLIGQAELVWSLNLGIPARDLDARPIKDGFLTAAIAGWHLAASKASIDVASTTEAVDVAREPSFQPRGIARELIQVIPEVAAGVTTYARSPARRPGAHLFVDVGATTLDSSLFLLNASQEGLKYAFLAADVDSERGAIRLHRYRAEALARMALDCFKASNPLQPIPTTAEDCVPRAEEIASVDAAFKKGSETAIAKVVLEARTKDPAGLSVPYDGKCEPIQVLLSGGGIRLPLYQDAIWDYGHKASPGGGLGLRVRPFQEAPIPQPQDLEAPNLSEEDWHRLGIAYGLSFRSDDIGEFVPPSAIPPMAPQQPRNGDDRFISKDQM